ncbi:hypothetical protein ACWIB8_05265 [Corynebacterium flavescens]
MPKTLADMSPAERDACRGMWVEFVDFDDSDGYEHSTGSSGPQLGILVGEIGTSGECEVLTLTHGVTQFCIPEWEITPRFDLPRAWGADGEPMKMSREWGISYKANMPSGLDTEGVYLTTDEEGRLDETMRHMREQEERGSISNLKLLTRTVTDWEAKP